MAARLATARGKLSAAVLAGWLAVGASIASGHEGPPYPIFMDRPTLQWIVSVWGDPDVGEGKFYILLEPRDGRAAPKEPKVSVWVQPVTERLPKATYQAERQTLRGRVQFLAKTQFDRQEMWKVGFVLEPSGGGPSGGKPAEFVAEVEVTPPGLGAWDLVIYSFPFAALGGLWMIGLARRWQAARQPGASSSSPSAARDRTHGATSEQRHGSTSTT